MILATYIPCKEEKIHFPIKCFTANTPEELLVNSVLFQSNHLEEELLVFQTDIYEIQENDFYIHTLPEFPIIVPIGSVMEGDAFVMDDKGNEFMPELQRTRRKECELFMKKDIPDEYSKFLKVQKKAFESYLLPLWAPVVLGRLTGEIYAIWPNAKLSPGDICKINHKPLTKLDILNMYFAKNMKPNDPCWCHSGIKYKKCHGRVVNE